MRLGREQRCLDVIPLFRRDTALLLLLNLPIGRRGRLLAVIFSRTRAEGFGSPRRRLSVSAFFIIRSLAIEFFPLTDDMGR